MAQGVFYLLMPLVVIGVCQALNLTLVTEPLNTLLGQIFVFLAGLLIFAVGFYLAGLTAGALRAGAAAQSAVLARVAWTAIVLFSSAIALRRMGLANDSTKQSREPGS